MTQEEKSIYDLIASSGSRITQLQLARKAFVGCHERFEGYNNPKQSTLRKVRQIIRDLRIKHHIFILSDKDGYWIMKDRSEAIEYVTRVERTAKAQAKAWYTTYQSMRRNFGINSDYFDKQGELF